MATITPAPDNKAPLPCSDTDVVCSDDLNCSEDGMGVATASTGTMVAA